MRPMQKNPPYPSVLRIVLFSVLLIGLLSGLLHNHISQKESAECSYCSGIVERPVTDLAVVLVGPLFTAIGYIRTPLAPQPSPISHTSTLIPRAPPAELFPF
jgi:hypothetical protein